MTERGRGYGGPIFARVWRGGVGVVDLILRRVVDLLRGCDGMEA